MDAEIVAGESPAQRWRTHCEQHGDRFLPLRGTSARCKRIEECEAEWIDQFGRPEVALTARAVAFRSIIELRGCSARDVGTFFNVDVQVIVAALSLLMVPAGRTRHVSRPPAPAQNPDLAIAPRETALSATGVSPECAAGHGQDARGTRRLCDFTRLLLGRRELGRERLGVQFRSGGLAGQFVPTVAARRDRTRAAS